jgi:serine/threonine protein kinase
MLGSGSFSKVYKQNVDGVACAVKVESADEKRPQLLYESRVLQLLRECRGVPRTVKYWVDGSTKNRHLAMELLGDNLETALRKSENGKRITTNSVSKVIAPQMLRILEAIHTKGILHRDLKPQNMVFDIESDQRVYLIDYGLSKAFREADGTHIPHKTGKKISGNLRYSGLNTLLGIESSRRDDLESLGYVLIYLANGGNLPWQSVETGGLFDPYKSAMRVKEAKLHLRVWDLCKGLPTPFALYLMYARNLRFDQDPDYGFLISLFESIV